MKPTLVMLALVLAAGACAKQDAPDPALQARGATVMGVDQYASTHLFDVLADGGRIELRSIAGDSADVETIRTHMKLLATAFAAGDFTAPGLVHAGDVPGTSDMAARRTRIRYEYRALPHGGEVRIITTDSAAIAAVHEFLAFQRRDHHARGTHE